MYHAGFLRSPSRTMGRSCSCGNIHTQPSPLPTSQWEDPARSLDGSETHIRHIRKWGCKVYRHINKKRGRKKFHKKSMVGFLVGYEPGKIYRIYHPGSKQFKV